MRRGFRYHSADSDECKLGKSCLDYLFGRRSDVKSRRLQPFSEIANIAVRSGINRLARASSIRQLVIAGGAA